MEPRDCLVFEDSRSGIKAGLAAKVAAVVGIRSELGDADLKEAGATLTVSDWTEVTDDVVDKLLQLGEDDDDGKATSGYGASSRRPASRPAVHARADAGERL